MRLYVDFDLLSSDAGPCGAAHALLRRAGYRPVLEYVSRHQSGLVREHTRDTHLPVLVTDSGEVIGTLARIMRWLAESQAQAG